MLFPLLSIKILCDVGQILKDVWDNTSSIFQGPDGDRGNAGASGRDGNKVLAFYKN